MIPRVGWCARFAVLLCLPVAASMGATKARAAEVASAASSTDLDVSACAAFLGARKVAAPPALLKNTLSTSFAPDKVWSVTGQGKTAHFRLAFKKPLAIGTILTSFDGPDTLRAFQPLSGRFVRYLKTSAVYPGDPNRAADWEMLGAGGLKTLPPNAKTRALLFSDAPAGAGAGDARRVELGPVLLFKDRYYDALVTGHASRSGKQNSAEVWSALWNDTQTLAGAVVMQQRTASPKAEYLRASSKEHPFVASPDEWARLGAWPQGGGTKVFAFSSPLQTRAIRLISPTYDGRGSFDGVVILAALGNRSGPPSSEAPAPPFDFAYNMPLDGFVAIDIRNKATGQHVRHLLAEEARLKGRVLEHWDLKDDKGALVPPGQYTWSAVARPPLKLTYETTVYSAGQPAWPAPKPGKGGGMWTADHTAPYTLGALGKTVFIGSQVVESGHGLIAVDGNGNKLWGEASISEGFSGPERITSDGKRYVYVVNDALVRRIDPQQGYRAANIFGFDYNRSLPGNGGHWSPFTGGAVVKGDRLYVSYSAPAIPHIQAGFLSDVVDPQKSIPSAWLRRGGGSRSGHDLNYGDGDYDEMMQLWATFLTEQTPRVTRSLANTPIPSSADVAYESVKDGPLAGTVTLALKEPIPVGSILVPDAKMKVYALKPNVDLDTIQPSSEDVGDVELGGAGDTPGGLDTDVKPFDPDLWIPIPTNAKAAGAPGVALTGTGGLRTRALRFLAGDRLPFALVMTRRFADVTTGAQRTFGEGAALGKSGWTAGRELNKPINTLAPAVMALTWDKPLVLRGVSFPYPNVGELVVENFVGAANADPKALVKDDSKWQELGRFDEQTFRYTSPKASLRNVDFGRDVRTRALRIRVNRPFSGRNPYTGRISPFSGVPHIDLPALVVYSPLGDDPAGLPPELHERITEIKLPTQFDGQATLVRHVPFPAPGQMALAPGGTIYTVSRGDIVTMNLDGKTPHVVVKRTGTQAFTAIAFDAAGLLYAADAGPQKVVRVFDLKTGRQLRVIGTPGGLQLGRYDPTRFDNPTGLVVDGAGKVWVTDNSYQPKRTTRWSRDGKLEAVFMGTTQYGGGGKLDEGDRSVLNYNGMKFRINWADPNHSWKLESILSRAGLKGAIAGAMPDRPLYFNGKRFLAGDLANSPIATLSQEANDIAIPRVAAGNLGLWDEVGINPALRRAFGTLNTSDYAFVWVDRNSDGAVQPVEVQLSKSVKFESPGDSKAFGDDLSLNFSGWKLKPTRFLANGTPDYDLKRALARPAITRPVWVTRDGRTFMLHDKLFAPDGKSVLWEYYDQWAVHEGFYKSGYGYNRPPGSLNQEHFPIGHLTVKTSYGNEELFVTNSDQGDWFVFTHDGQLVGCIFGGPAGYGLRHWTMPDWRAGKVDLSDVRLPQEHYGGCVVKANDGKVYAVAGHNFAGVVRVDGLEKMQRMAGVFTVGQADQTKSQTWALQKATLDATHLEPKAARVPFVSTPPDLDASLADWPDDVMNPIHEYWDRGFSLSKFITYAKGGFAYDDQNLYVAAWTLDPGELQNSAQDKTLLFKGGDALDILIGTDPKADPKRRGPVPGDCRIIISRVGGKPVAMLYRFKVPDAPAGKGVIFKSPVGETSVDIVQEIKSAKISIAGARFKDGNGWIIEAAIPWKALGVEAPGVGTRLRGDIGILQGDENGQRTVGRLYWAGKSQTVVSDTPSEARVSPSVWGDLYFVEPSDTMKFGPDDGGISSGGDTGGMDGPELP